MRWRSLAKVLCRVLCRLLSTVRGHCIAKDYAGHEARLCTVSFLEASMLEMLPCDGDEMSSGRKSICSCVSLMFYAAAVGDASQIVSF